MDAPKEQSAFEDPSFERLRQLSEPTAILDPDLLARVIEVLPFAVLMIDASGVIRFVNHQCELLFGFMRQALLGQQVEVLLPERLRSAHVEHRRRFFADPRPRPMGAGITRPLTGLHRNGGEIALKIELCPIMTVHGVYAIAVFGRRDYADLKGA